MRILNGIRTYDFAQCIDAQGSLKLLGTGFFLTYLFAYWMHRAKDKWNELLIAIMAGYFVQILRNIEWGNLSNFIFRQPNSRQ